MAAASTDDPSKVRVAMAFEGDPFSMDVRAGVVDKINEYGMKTIIDDQLPQDLSDMSTTLTKVKALKPDVLIVSGHSKGAATAACLLYTSPSPRDGLLSRMPSSA